MDKLSDLYTPTLLRQLDDFETYLEIIGNAPILLVGESGVGKSLFLRRFANHWEQKKKKTPVLADCSHFLKETARSELFGHVRGAFTGADKDHPGLIEVANGTSLILDEIGELPENVQAMLLTFVETGKYRKMGQTTGDMLSSSARIIGATNREDILRKELKYRFFPFYIKPLHERRSDVLSYLAHSHEEVFKSLRGWEVTTLLSYHWPGNVREINRVGKMLEFTARVKDRYLDTLQDKIGRMWNFNDKRISGIIFENILNFFYAAQDNGVDIRLIDELMSHFGITLLGRGEVRPFALDGPVWVEGEDGRYLGEEYQHAIDMANRGFGIFCQLFCLKDSSDWNLLTPPESWCFDKTMQQLLPILVKDRSNEEQGKYKVAMKQVENFLRTRTGSVADLPGQSTVGNVVSDPLQHIDLTSYTPEELNRKYYKQLLDSTGGNTRAAAGKIDVSESTLRGRLKKHNIK